MKSSITARIRLPLIAFFLLALAASVSGQSTCTVSLTPSLASPQQVGTFIRWTAAASGCGTDPVFRFSISTDAGANFSMARDFARGSVNAPRNWFDWRPMAETMPATIDYVIRVDAKPDYISDDSQIMSTTSAFKVLPVTDYAQMPVVNPTRHPLVALYSAPPCDPSHTVHVEFRAQGQPWKQTNSLPCVANVSRNFLVAGMTQQTQYEMRHVLSNGRTSRSTTFTTLSIPANVVFPQFSVQKPIDENTYTRFNVAWNGAPRGVWADTQGNAAIPNAHDLNGTPLWYWHTPTLGPELTDPFPIGPLVGGTTLIMARDSESPSPSVNFSLTVLREFDLDGTPLWETNSQAVSSRTNLGASPFRVWGFHHDAVRSEDGNTLVVGHTLRCLPSNIDAGYTCPTGDTLWLGTALVVLDSWGQVLWKWNSFDTGHINPMRPAPLDYPICRVLTGDCPILNARDYVHTNSARFVYDDHGAQILMNSRFQNWAFKIDYSSGTGSGKVLWRFGADGCWNLEAACFTTSDSANWFSHAHDVHVASDGTILLFDNGNNRCAGVDPYFCTHPSRAQSWSIDELHGTAEPKLNFNFEDALSFDGVTPHTMYSDALGSAQRLPNNNWLFTAGNTKPRNCGNSSCNLPRYGYVIEVSTSDDGTPIQTFTYQHTSRIYRAFRMRTLYEGTEAKAR
jgi:hypothetical protein